MEICMVLKENMQLSYFGGANIIKRLIAKVHTELFVSTESFYFSFK